MKTYKLVKKYPGSPELGSESFESLGYKQSDFPEFWQELKEVPEYVKCIKSYVNGCKASIKDTVYDTKIKPDFSTLNWVMLYTTSRFIPSTKEEYDAQFDKYVYHIGNSLTEPHPSGTVPYYIYLDKESYCKKNNYKYFDSKKECEIWANTQIPDYEILSFITIHKELVTKRSNGRYMVERTNPTPITPGATFEQELNYMVKYNHRIHSVKRLSDGEIFTVGDKVGAPNCSIKSFYIESNRLRVVYATLSSHDSSDYLEHIQKAKQPLFTTEDGVDIQVGNDVWNLKTIKSPDNNYVIIHKKELEKLVKTKLK